MTGGSRIVTKRGRFSRQGAHAGSFRRDVPLLTYLPKGVVR
jgi:hypothetical protein